MTHPEIRKKVREKNSFTTFSPWTWDKHKKMAPFHWTQLQEQLSSRLFSCSEHRVLEWVFEKLHQIIQFV